MEGKENAVNLDDSKPLASTKAFQAERVASSQPPRSKAGEQTRAGETENEN
jgi:hypothetical protein